MVTIKLAHVKQTNLFRSPSSPHLTVKKRLLKKSLQKTVSHMKENHKNWVV